MRSGSGKTQWLRKKAAKRRKIIQKRTESLQDASGLRGEYKTIEKAWIDDGGTKKSWAAVQRMLLNNLRLWHHFGGFSRASVRTAAFACEFWL